jgi:hypothetical protein
MSLSLAAAVKAHLETLGLGIPWFRDESPPYKGDGTEQMPPFGVVIDGLNVLPRMTGDRLAKRATEQVQVDVYEYELTPVTKERAESYTLAKDVVRGLLGARLSTAPEYVWRCMVSSQVRFRDPTAHNGLGEVRNSITLDVIRDIQSRAS